MVRATQGSGSPGAKLADEGVRPRAEQRNVDDLRTMLRIRRFEDAAAEQYARARIGGFLHLYNGQEAVAVGAIPLLRDDDYVVTHYRDHGHAIARGIDPRRIMAELFGKSTGVSGGKGGSMHLFDKERRFMGGYAIVGGHLPLACGLALEIQYRQKDGAVMCIHGDGSVNEGEWHESMNLAAVWKLPVLFLCENNGYAMGTEISRTSAETEVYRRALAYNMPAERVDGMELWAVREATERALRHLREGKGPYFLETLTYRFRGHSMADPELYRSKDEVSKRRSADPIERVRAALEEAGLLDDAGYRRIVAEVEAEIEAAVRFSEESPDPPMEALYEDVYRGIEGTGTTGGRRAGEGGGDA